MLNITLICVGRLKDAFFEEASAEYLKRLKAYAKLSVVEVKAAPLPDEPNTAQINAALQKEADEILSKIPQGAKIISLCIEGELFSSEKLADEIKNCSLCGVSHIVFIIGGSCGLSQQVKQKSTVRLSMSLMTFPHRLARVMLLEQIYRACKINANEKYHK